MYNKAVYLTSYQCSSASAKSYACSWIHLGNLVMNLFSLMGQERQDVGSLALVHEPIGIKLFPIPVIDQMPLHKYKAPVLSQVRNNSC